MAILRGIVAGLVAGIVGAGAMSIAHKAFPAAAEQEQGEDSTVKVADSLTRRLLGRPLPDDKKPLAGNIVHYAFGAGVGALYGGLAAVVPRVTVALGLPFGVAVWLGAHVIMVPALGLAAPPTRQPLSKEALELALHLVYGAVTELGRRLIRQTL
jgi:putative membrane protein